MGDTNFRGPLGAMGSLEAQYTSATTAEIEPLDGPSYFYQGVVVADPRSYPINKDGLLPGRVPGFINNPFFCTVDNVPQAASTTALAAAQVLTATVAMSLATVGIAVASAGQAWIAVGVPFIPAGTTVATSVIALDFGFTTGTTTANSSSVNVPDSTLFTQGQWIVIGNVANTQATQSLIAQVQTATNATTIQVSPSPATALCAPIGGANLWGSALLPPATQFGPSAPTATAVSKTLQAGVTRVHNPAENLARNLSITSVSTTNGTGQVLVTGWDLWGNVVTELLTSVGTATVYGKKGFKYLPLNAAVAQQTLGTSYTLGLGDTFEFPVRADRYEQVLAYAGNTAVTNNVGFAAAVTTTPATNTTGDVRGTLQISGLGAGTGITNNATTNNVLRLTVYQSPAVNAIINTTPNNSVPMFGVAQSTT